MSGCEDNAPVGRALDECNRGAADSALYGGVIAGEVIDEQK